MNNNNNNNNNINDDDIFILAHYNYSSALQICLSASFVLFLWAAEAQTPNFVNLISDDERCYCDKKVKLYLYIHTRLHMVAIVCACVCVCTCVKLMPHAHRNIYNRAHSVYHHLLHICIFVCLVFFPLTYEFILYFDKKRYGINWMRS